LFNKNNIFFRIGKILSKNSVPKFHIDRQWGFAYRMEQPLCINDCSMILQLKTLIDNGTKDGTKFCSKCFIGFCFPFQSSILIDNGLTHISWNKHW